MGLRHRDTDKSKFFQALEFGCIVALVILTLLGATTLVDVNHWIVFGMAGALLFVRVLLYVLRYKSNQSEPSKNNTVSSDSLENTSDNSSR